MKKQQELNSMQEKIQKLQAESMATESLFNYLPEGLNEPDLTVWHNSKSCEFGLVYKVENMEQVNTLVEAWEPWRLPLLYTEGYYKQFRTANHEPDRFEKTTEEIFPIKVDVSIYDVSFEFYAMVDGHMLRISIEQDFQKYLGVASVGYETKISHDEKYIDRCWIKTPGFKGYRQIKWASGSHDHPNSFTIYWPSSYTWETIFTEAE